MNKAMKPIHNRPMIKRDWFLEAIQYYIRITLRSHTASSYKLMLCAHMRVSACIHVCACECVYTRACTSAQIMHSGANVPGMISTVWTVGTRSESQR